jgi:3-deoxy-D-manno-octulosonic-acid transferase
MVDRLGELINLYSIADRVILGGSFIPGIGGHNPMEIAHFGKPLIIGPYADHQRELLKLVEGVVETPIEGVGEVVNADSLPSTTILNRVDLDRVWELIKIG